MGARGLPIQKLSRLDFLNPYHADSVSVILGSAYLGAVGGTVKLIPAFEKQQFTASSDDTNCHLPRFNLAAPTSPYPSPTHSGLLSIISQNRSSSA